MTAPTHEAQTERESELRWGAHAEVHKSDGRETDRRFAELTNAADRVLASQQAALAAALADHHREHSVHETAHKAEHLASAAAIEKSEATMAARFASVNEFRGQLSDQARTFATTDRIDALLGAANQRNELLVKDIDRRFLEQAKLIDIERTARVRAESSLGTIRAVALFLGPVGIAGVVLGLIAVFGPS